MNLKRAVVIPTYWSRKGGEWRDGDLVFDHPTPLDEKGTLQRCLESLNKLEGSFDLVLIAVSTHPDVQESLEIKLNDLLNSLDLHYRVIPIFPSTIREIHKRLGDETVKEVLNLNGYSQVRNGCILIPLILGFDTFILLDDDEVVLDKDFLSLATEYLGELFTDREIIAKAGIYIQPHGSPFFKDKETTWRFFLNGKKAMNEAFKIIELGNRIVDTPFAFGGNMVISKKVIEEGISFDPYIPRGEDIDFLVNVKVEGYAFVLDTALRILHLPTKSRNPDWIKLRQDASRLLYMRCKMNLLKSLNVKCGITPKDLEPYPGSFLNWTLRPRIFLTSILLAIDYALRLKFDDSREALSNIKLLFKNYSILVSKYLLFKEKWKETTLKLINSPDLVDILLKNIVDAEPRRQ